jgi:plasmid stabilization system protein ParE
MKMPARPEVVFTAQADRDIYRCGLFLERIGLGRPKKRMREIRAAARRLRDAPRIYPVQEVHPISGLEFRRRNVGQFTMLDAYLEPTSSNPSGTISVRRVRHSAEQDVWLGVEESRAPGAVGSRGLRTGQDSEVRRIWG